MNSASETPYERPSRSSSKRVHARIDARKSTPESVFFVSEIQATDSTAAG